MGSIPVCMQAHQLSCGVHPVTPPAKGTLAILCLPVTLPAAVQKCSLPLQSTVSSAWLATWRHTLRKVLRAQQLPGSRTPLWAYCTTQVWFLCNIAVSTSIPV